MANNTTAPQRKHCAQRLPLVRKAWGETPLSDHFVELGRTAQHSRRFDGIGAQQYARMISAVETAIVPNTTQPIVLDVDDGESHWYLTYCPKSRVVGMRFLQLLETLEEADRTALLLAAHHPDLLAEPRPQVLQKHCGTADIGRFERTHDIDDLHPFLYHQRCRLTPGWELL